MTVVDLLPNATFFGASWGSRDTIVYSQSADEPAGLWQVSAAGGEAQPFSNPDTELGSTRPQFLPGGEAVLAVRQLGQSRETAQVAALSLSTGSWHTLIQGTSPRFLSSGHLIFARGDSLWRVPFDAAELNVTGDPIPVLEGAQTGPGRWQISTDGGREALWSVPVELTDTFTAGHASLVFALSSYTGTGVLFGRTYDVSPDGQSFLLIREEGIANAEDTIIVVVQNWTDELQRLVPVP